MGFCRRYLVSPGFAAVSLCLVGTASPAASGKAEPHRFPACEKLYGALSLKNLDKSQSGLDKLETELGTGLEGAEDAKNAYLRKATQVGGSFATFNKTKFSLLMTYVEYSNRFTHVNSELRRVAGVLKGSAKKAPASDGKAQDLGEKECIATMEKQEQYNRESFIRLKKKAAQHLGHVAID